VGVLEPHLVLGENASQAMQFAASGSTQGGVVPLSLSKAEEVAARPLRPRSGGVARTEPLRQRMVLLKTAGTPPRVLRLLQTPAARDLLVRYGFLLPDDASP